ncbi:hypothetical protein PMF13cell1_05196 [Blautia producta]|uniref:Uroporphyrinogen decarboxylase (URO-D) domain-containing protein n=1 Tax=Blautia producta TaxID=33035 RepID=A0A4P6M7U6_9FIRM|nr:uroporphyrinogen decarboxylase family protein [Blautia producta]QBE99617.1 hypothetical protein PMF13cell1_05196 [Blautia producta]
MTGKNIEKLLDKYKEELKIIKKAKLPKVCMWPPMPIRNTPISARENYLRMARREKPLFMPLDIDEMMLSPAIFPDAVARAFVVDNNEPNPDMAGGKDMFGVEWVYVKEAGGSMVRPGNPMLKDIEKWDETIVFPDISRWDWEGSSRLNQNLISKDHAMNCWIMNGLFERLISFMDFENAAVALIDEEQQEFVHSLFKKLTELYVDMIDHIKKYYDVDVIYFHDDWGAQRAPFFSADVCREMLAPYLKQIVEAVHERGMLFNFHSCGKIELLVPVMIECGVDIWCGQPMNDFDILYEKYGTKIALGIYFEPPTPLASQEEVISVCQQFIDTYTKNGCAFPVIYSENIHPEFYEIMYVLSREAFLHI